MTRYCEKPRKRSSHTLSHISSHISRQALRMEIFKMVRFGGALTTVYYSSTSILSILIAE